MSRIGERVIMAIAREKSEESSSSTWPLDAPFKQLAGHSQRTCVRSNVARDISTVLSLIKVKRVPHQCSSRLESVGNKVQ